MIRPPSLVRQWDAYFSGDPAFKQPPSPPPDDAPQADKDEYVKALESHANALRVARETGDWSPLLIEGQQATKFVMGQVDRNAWRAIMDRVILPVDSPLRIGQVTMYALLFRLSCKSIAGWDKFDRSPDPAWESWMMAPAGLVTALDEINPAIVGELGADVFARLQTTRPF